ncbi:shikimate dehydrogenase family protein [Pseudomonas fluorescens]|uniref:shikimate dehydrogenase (NADP(+)) n=1 Tax=Pseudomonas fluorescens TaxID=294 RepID=A0A5E7APT6_PSEFL|nr:shikimate dehydrogenase [Pseudomonas fluorescens]VVN78754.1 Shikimate dehydrogenase (NADP(+)) [Pseudomonas fluorescens]
MHISGHTNLIGIVADPIAHVKTPEVINQSAANQGLDLVCVPLHVRGSNLQKVLAGVSGIANLRGLVVTIPYKETIVDYCDELTVTAKQVGSVNAVRIEAESGRLIGGNFDGEGMLIGLHQQGHRLEGKRVLLVGAGGAGKSIAYSVAQQQPAQLAIYNRSPARAQALVDRLQGQFPSLSLSLSDGNAEDFDVIINATSLGLRDDDSLPLDPATLSPDALVCEAVMRSGDTALLAAARARGCAVHHGQHMIYGQIVQICRFLGVDLQNEHLARILGP